MKISQITEKLYGERPDKVLYHYTSLYGLAGIIESRSIWSTEIRYFSDAAEMKHTVDLLRVEIDQRLECGTSDARLLKQLREWLYHRITDGHMLFVVSFTAEGNLLSQWRGYCPYGKGVSLGFDPDYIVQCADKQSFGVVRCIYDMRRKKELLSQIVDAIEILAKERGENTDPPKRHPSQSYHDVFEEVEGELLKVAAAFKHPSFEEEDEWRLVSPIISNFVITPIKYREGTSMLVPYIEFSLAPEDNRPVRLQHIFLGPTPHVNLSMTSLHRYVSRITKGHRLEIDYCGIPYRPD